MFKSKDSATLVGLAAYLLIVAAGPLLKAIGIMPLARWSWWQASALLWVPPVLSLAWVVLTLGWLLVRPRLPLSSNQADSNGING